MTKSIQTLNKIINDSELTDIDKEDFISFLDGISKDDISQIIQLFTNNPDEVVTFWATLKEKLLFLQTLNESEDFSDEAKQDIANQVSQMNNEEFDVFIDTIRKIQNGANPNQLIEEINKESEKNHQEFMELAQEFLDKTKEYQQELAQEVSNEQ
jgi:hypothetical protein